MNLNGVVNIGKIIAQSGIKTEKGYVYFVTKEGDIGQAQMQRKRKGASKKIEIVAK